MKKNLLVDECTFVGCVDFQVVGVKDERLGEQVCACIRLRDGEPCTAEEIKAYCKGQVQPAYLTPPELFSGGRLMPQVRLTVNPKMPPFCLNYPCLSVPELRLPTTRYLTILSL